MAQGRGKALITNPKFPDRLSPDASGILVQLPRAATECKFELVPEPGQVMQRAWTWDAKEHSSTQALKEAVP